jgi:hypothetical protein
MVVKGPGIHAPAEDMLSFVFRLALTSFEAVISFRLLHIAEFAVVEAGTLYVSVSVA